MIKNIPYSLLAGLLFFSIKSLAQTQGVPEAGYSRCLIYSGTGADQTFTAPATCVYYIKLWGAGGGGDNWNLGGSYTQKGGGGGFASGTLTLAKNKALTFIVGKGGIRADGNYTSSTLSGVTTYGGGGAGGTSTGYGASGGGRSAIRYDVNANSSIDLPGEEIITAGGGGGASAGTNSQSQQGGPAGGTSGTAGTNTGTAAANNGGAGTAAAGGAAGTGGSANGTSGSQFTGGRGGNLVPGSGGSNDGGGGGGGGWYGGGGGTSRVGIGDAPGGGGSSHYAAPIAGGSITAASTSTAGNTADVHWASGVGRGGDITTNSGGDGRIVIQWNEDHGDAPSSYGDAGHGIPTSPTIYLGINPPDGDSYANVTTFSGQSTAAGDESTTSADEDGAASSITIPRSSSSFSQPVIVHNTSGSNATLSGWIDFNKNGTFDASERVQATVSNGATSASLLWTGIPAPLVVGTSYMRFRISSVAADVATSAGTAIDGEIEDFPVVFVSPLPVELISFSAVLEDCQAKISWISGSEINSNRIELEHSTNGYVFDKIKTFVSTETSTSKKTYNFTDSHIYEGINYYRLKMIDNNGAIKFTSVIMVENFCKIIDQFPAYPNPFEDKLIVTLAEQLKNSSKIIITDSRDKIVLHHLVSASLQAQTKIVLNTSALNTGVYYLKFMDASNNIIGKIQKVVKK